MDIKVQQAKEHHAAAAGLDEQARRRRSMRDHLIRQLHEEDPGLWSFSRIAAEVGCSKGLVAFIVTGRRARA